MSGPGVGDVLRAVAEYAEAMQAHKESLTNTPAGPLYNRAHISAAAARVVAADAVLRALNPSDLRALAAQAEAGAEAGLEAWLRSMDVPSHVHMSGTQLVAQIRAAMADAQAQDGAGAGGT